MLGLDYGSDSDEEGGVAASSSVKATPKTLVAQKPKASSSGLALPAPKATKKSATKKILVELPKLAKRASDDEDEVGRPAAKKTKLDGERGARSSGLLSMLPAPKRSTMELPPPQRVLGGGRQGIAYSASSSSSTKPTSVQTEPSLSNPPDNDEAPDTSSQSLLPPSLLLKGKGKPKQPPTPSETLDPLPPSESSKTSEETNFFSLGMLLFCLFILLLIALRQARYHLRRPEQPLIHFQRDRAHRLSPFLQHRPLKNSGHLPQLHRTNTLAIIS